MKADILAEQMLVPVLCTLWPNVPVLCEEADHSGLPGLAPEITLLPYEDSNRDLPETCISIDGLDGSALYANSEFNLSGISVGLIQDGKPTAGIVMMLDSDDIFHCGIADTPGVFVNSPCVWGDQPLVRFPQNDLKGSLIGLDDNKHVTENWRTGVINKINADAGNRYNGNVPSVAGGMKVLRGNYAAYITSNARNWDLAGVAALCHHAGLIVREMCIQQGPLWRYVRMAPVIFARDEETIKYVYSLVNVPV